MSTLKPAVKPDGDYQDDPPMSNCTCYAEEELKIEFTILHHLCQSSTENLSRYLEFCT